MSEIEKLKSDFLALQNRIKEQEAEVAQLRADKEAAEKRAEDEALKAAVAAHQKRDSEATALFESGIKDGKLTDAMRAIFLGSRHADGDKKGLHLRNEDGSYVKEGLALSHPDDVRELLRLMPPIHSEDPPGGPSGAPPADGGNAGAKTADERMRDLITSYVASGKAKDGFEAKAKVKADHPELAKQVEQERRKARK